MFQKSLNAVSILLALAAGGLVWHNWPEISHLILNIRTEWLGAGLVCYLINYFFRGLRLQCLTDHRLHFFKQALYFSVLHGFSSYVLPLRTGDVSLPILLKSTGKVQLPQGIWILLKTRLLDLSVLGIFTVLGSFFGARTISSKVQFIWFATGFILFVSFFLVKRIGWISRFLVPRKFKPTMDLDSAFTVRASEFFFTGMIWLCMYASQYCMIRAINLDLTFSEIIFISAIQFPLQLLPVQGLANAGNHESGWLASMVLMGFPMTTALESALASHGILLIYIVVLGILGFIMPKKT